MKIFNAILGVYAIFNSLYCIFWPEESVLGIGWIIAIFLALWGISAIAEYRFSKKSVKGLRTDGGVGLALGIIAMVISVLSLSSDFLSAIFTIVIIICLALGIAVKGITELADSKKNKNAWNVVSAALHLAAGVFGVFSIAMLSEKAPLAIGIMMLVVGIAEIGSVFGNDPSAEQSEIW